MSIYDNLERTGLRELVARIEHSRSSKEVAEHLGELLQPLFGASAMSFVYAPPGGVSPDCVLLKSDEVPAAWMLGSFMAAFGTIEREIARMDQVVARGQLVYEPEDLLEAPRLHRTSVYNEFWTPCRVQRQVVGVLTEDARFAGIVCVARSGREAPFTRDHVRALRVVRRLVQRWCDQRRNRTDLSVLTALAEGLDLTCSVFNELGHAVWMTRRARSLAGTVVAELGGRPVFSTHSSNYQRWQETARAAFSSGGPVQAGSGGRVQASLQVHGQVRFAVVVEDGGPAAVSPRADRRRAQDTVQRVMARRGVFHPAGSATRQAELVARIELLGDAWGLSPRQREVLLLLALGRTNKQISETLGCSLGTAELHVSAVLRRAGASSRSEVLSQIWLGPVG